LRSRFWGQELGVVELGVEEMERRSEGILEEPG
jgi:hypothetical protein